MNQGEPLNPYRNFLAEAEQNLETERSALGARAATLGALRPLLPRGLRRELARLERAIQRPVRNSHDVELAQRCLDAYAERVDVAIAFSDHVARARAMRWRRLRTWCWWALGAGGAVLVLVVLVLVDDRSEPPPPLECRLGSDSAPVGYSRQGTTTPMSEAPNSCGLSAECARQGLCNSAAEGCYASSDEDCAGSWGCKLDGLCKVVAGRCTSVAAPAFAPGPAPRAGPSAGKGARLH